MCGMVGGCKGSMDIEDPKDYAVFICLHVWVYEERRKKCEKRFRINL